MDFNKLSKQEFEVKADKEFSKLTNIHYFQLLSPARSSQADGLGANTEASAAGPRTSVGLKKSISLGGLTPPLPSISLPLLTNCLLLVKEDYGGGSEGDPLDGGGTHPHPVLQRAVGIPGDHHGHPGGKQGQTLNLLVLVIHAKLGLAQIRFTLVLSGQHLDHGLEQDAVVGSDVGNATDMRAKSMDTGGGDLEGPPGLVTEEVLADDSAESTPETKEDEMKSREPLFKREIHLGDLIDGSFKTEPKSKEKGESHAQYPSDIVIKPVNLEYDPLSVSPCEESRHPHILEIGPGALKPESTKFLISPWPPSG